MESAAAAQGTAGGPTIEDLARQIQAALRERQSLRAALTEVQATIDALIARLQAVES